MGAPWVMVGWSGPFNLPAGPWHRGRAVARGMSSDGQAVMSTVDAEVETPGAPLQESDPPGGHTELTSARLARVGDVEVRRLLPLPRRLRVGGRCSVDDYRPRSVD